MQQTEMEEFFNRAGLRVGRYSKGEFSIYCPFHDDTNASLYVNPVKGKFHCFAGCVKGSKGITALLKNVRKGLDVQFMMRFPDLVWEEETEPEETVIDINVDNLPLAKVNDYLQRRKITLETINHFGIRYHLGYEALIVPVNDINGELVGYIRRNLRSNPKYLNSKGMSTGSLLYPLDKFQPLGGQVIVVEGVFDAIRAHQSGFTNVVSTLGGEIKKNQLNILLEYAREVIICPDRDSEGVRIAEKNLRLLRKYGVPTGLTRPPGASKDLAESVTLTELPVTPDFVLDFGKRSLQDFLGVH